MQDNQLLDQQGMSYITHILSQKDCIINEYRRENGIDAICELRAEPYQSTGLFYAVQLKTGASYFEYSDADNYYFYADDKHIDYWLKCIMPVLFVIYNPKNSLTLWTSIQKSNLIRTGKGCKIAISRNNHLQELKIISLYEAYYGKIYTDSASFEAITNDLKNLKYEANNAVSISGLELFINGLCNSCRQLYFNMDLYSNLVEDKMQNLDISSFAWPTNFFEDYFCIINFHNLIVGSFELELKEINEYELLPIFVKYLSNNGLGFVNYLRGKGYDIHDRLFIGLNSFFIPFTE